MRGTAVALAAAAAAGFLAAGCSATGHTVTTSTSTAKPASVSHPATARVGGTLTITGMSSGEKMAVKLVRVITDAHGSDQFNTPDKGNRFVAVQFQLTDSGSSAYSDSPDNSAAVIDSKGQTYESDISTVAGCQSFPGSLNIPVGGTRLGCVVFQVPKTAKITGVQFTLDSGMGPDTGQWKA
ncbi:MAG: DUF4352 domain-containing protein [Actinomycetota bacterium]|nr:DUF4352 domain-containing protein [Actinomycetota bacterium]